MHEVLTKIDEFLKFQSNIEGNTFLDRSAKRKTFKTYFALYSIESCKFIYTWLLWRLFFALQKNRVEQCCKHKVDQKAKRKLVHCSINTFFTSKIGYNKTIVENYN